MSGLLLSALVGAVFGALGAVITVALYRGRRGTRGDSAPAADDESSSRLIPQADDDPLAAEFAQHARAVRQQVTRYADLLADGDAVLRARLRRFEDGAA